MRPTIVHRYVFSLNEAAACLLGPAEFAGVEVRVVDDEVIIDAIMPHTHNSDRDVETQPQPSAEPANDEPKPKGGPLARRSAILCGEKVFQVFLEVETKEEARAAIHERCGVETRAELDNNEEAARRWKDIEAQYRIWLEGYD